MDFKQFYDQQKDYSAFRNDPEKREEYTMIVNWKADQLLKLVPGNTKFDNILEVGCAMGILLNTIANRLSIRNTFGLDISEENIKVARELYPETVFFQGTIEDYEARMPEELPESKFQLVVLSDIVEHIPDDLKFMESIRNISSYALINLPLEKSFKNRNRNYGESDPSGHLRCYDKEMADRLVHKAGFEVISSFTSNALNDKDYFRLYRQRRSVRINNKPISQRIFWSIFYKIEDQIKLVSKSFYEKVYGTNYFALLKAN